MSDKRKCDDCALAAWKRTKAGHLHPDKSGRCQWTTEYIALPNSRYYLNGETLPIGGRIERGYAYKNECPQYVEQPGGGA